MANAPFISPVLTFAQEIVTAQLINNSDAAITDQLDFLPVSPQSLDLHVERDHMTQGVGADYTVSGQVITWLASSGTAPNLAASDVIVASYQHE